MKGYQWPDQGTGWDVAALSDLHPEYEGSCSRCYEVGRRAAGGCWLLELAERHPPG
jgi:hypothetical protein